MAHGLPNEPGTHITTEAEQHKLDSWDDLVEALERTTRLLAGIAEGERELHAVRHARTALRAAKA